MAEQKKEIDKKEAKAVAEGAKASKKILAEDLDTVERHRLLGATIWFAVLIWLLPKWYAKPVNFQPELPSNDAASVASIEQKPIADKVYRLPNRQVQNIEDPDARTAKPEKPKAVATEPEQNKVALSDAGEALIADDLMVAKGWFVRLAAFKKMATANELLGKLDEAGFEGYVKPIQNGQFFIVVIGPYTSKQEALEIKQEVDPRYHVKALVFHR